MISFFFRLYKKNLNRFLINHLSIFLLVISIFGILLISNRHLENNLSVINSCSSVDNYIVFSARPRYRLGSDQQPPLLDLSNFSSTMKGQLNVDLEWFEVVDIKKEILPIFINGNRSNLIEGENRYSNSRDDYYHFIFGSPDFYQMFMDIDSVNESSCYLSSNMMSSDTGLPITHNDNLTLSLNLTDYGFNYTNIVTNLTFVSSINYSISFRNTLSYFYFPFSTYLDMIIP